jgi:hypothetical protein
MNGKTQERFYQFVQDFINEEHDITAVRVTNVEQKTNSSGYCESCYSEWEEVDITYIDGHGSQQIYNFYGSLAEILGFDN